jgi:hypothetical protein
MEIRDVGGIALLCEFQISERIVLLPTHIAYTVYYLDYDSA